MAAESSLGSNVNLNKDNSFSDLKIARLSNNSSSHNATDMSPSSPSSTRKTQIVVNLDGSYSNLQNITTTATNIPISDTIQPNNLHGSIKSNRSTKSCSTVLKPGKKTKQISLVDRFSQQSKWKRLLVLIMTILIVFAIFTSVTILIFQLNKIYLCDNGGEVTPVLILLIYSYLNIKKSFPIISF